MAVKWPLFVNIGLILLLAHAMVVLVGGWPFTEPELRTSHSEAGKETDVFPGQPRRDVGVDRIAGWHLFGEASAKPARKAPKEAPATRLKLTLFGVIADDRGEAQSRAIIAGPNGVAESFEVGESVPGGAEVTEIYADRVILLRKGKYEALRLPRQQLQLEPAGR